MKISDLKVGQFAKVNGSIIYRYKTTPITLWPSLYGFLTIEKHPEKTLNWMDLEDDEISIIELPQRKHVNNTIKQIKDSLKFKFIDNLTYIENLSILKNYLKSDIVKSEK